MDPADPGAIRATVTLIHGTFARKATWVSPDGSIGKALRDRFGQAVHIAAFRWSGRNGSSARYKAAIDLADHLKSLKRDFPNARHFLVAHSHGGNVALYSAASDDVRPLIEGIVTLATPFIVCRERNLGPAGLFGRAFVFVFLVPIMLLSILAVEVWFPRPTFWGQNTVGYMTWVLLYIPVVVLWFIWGSFSDTLYKQLQLGTMAKDKLVILRGVADEASLSIAALGALSMLSNAVARMVARLVEVTRQLPAKLAPQRSWVVFLFIAGGLALAAVIAWLWLPRYAQLTMFTRFVAFWLLCHIMVTPFIASAIGLEEWDSTPTYVFGLLGVPATALALIGMLPFGWRIALASLALDVTVESSPPGTYEVTLVIPEAVTKSDRAVPLLHSALYDDRKVIERIVAFVEANVPHDTQTALFT